MRIVADTNVLISSIFWTGAPYKIIQKCAQRDIELITCQEILNEIRKVLKSPKEKFQLSEKETDAIVQTILFNAEIIALKTIIAIVRDPKDNMIVSCAIDAQADYIVTRDKDLLELKEYERIRIITPEEFVLTFRRIF